MFITGLVLTAVLLGGGTSITLAQSGPTNTPVPTATPTPVTVSAPTSNIAVRDGANPGEVVVSWDAVTGATHYRIGYVNMVTDYPLAKASVTGDWINAFIYVDENAQNLPVSNGRVEYTVRRLEQGARHAFTVLTSNNFVDTGAAGNVSSKFAWPSNQRWTFLTVADRGGAPAPAPPVDYISMYPNCDAVRAHYPGGVRIGSPIYRPALDRDGDGIACESTSSDTSGNFLPIRNIGTFTGTGDDADIVISLDAGLYRATSTHSGEGHFGIWAESVATDDRELLANDIGNVREVETFRVGDGFLQNPPGNYLLSITAEGDWTVHIELIGAS